MSPLVFLLFISAVQSAVLPLDLKSTVNNFREYFYRKLTDASSYITNRFDVFREIMTDKFMEVNNNLDKLKSEFEKQINRIENTVEKSKNKAVEVYNTTKTKVVEIKEKFYKQFYWSKEVAVAWGKEIENKWTPEDHKPTPGMVEEHGYICEIHEVTTEDGYILTVHRISAKTSRGIKTPIFLQHGLLGSSADWVIPGPNKSLSYILVDKGYDVWLGNARGNLYSRMHINYTIEDPEFWNFSWHEMGVYDIPSVIDYILHTTGNEQLYYIGHSMGTTMSYVMATKRPETAAKIKLMFSLAPVALMNNIKSPIKLLAPFAGDIQFLAKYFGEYQLAPDNRVVEFLSKYGCDSTAFGANVCKNFLFCLCGYDHEQFNEALLPSILGHVPAGTSLKTLVHYAQVIHSGKFQEYDLGEQENLMKYNSSTPPEYDLSVINVPISLHYADNDWLSSIVDLNDFVKRLKCKVNRVLVKFPGFNHIDFLWAKDVPELVYNDIERILACFEESEQKSLSRRKKIDMI